MADAMMDAANLGVGKGRPGGYAAVAPAGTDLKAFEDMTKTLAEIIAANPAVRSLGYISEDGVTFSMDTSSDDHADWGGTIIDSNMSSYAETCATTFLESRDSVLATVYGDGNVATAGAVTTVRHNNDFTAPHVFVFDSVVSPTKVRRSIIPQGRIFERDDLSLNNSDLAGYAPTIKCMPYTGYDNDTYRDLYYDTAKAGAAGAAAAGE